MKLKTNLFEQIKQYFYDDGADVHWWIDEEDHESFKEAHSDWFEENPDWTYSDTRTLSGKAWNEWWIGGTFGDYEGKFVNEQCPKCEHLLVDPETEYDKDGELVTDARHCSNHDCDYVNDSFQKVLDANERYWNRSGSKPETKFRIEGETVFEFVERVGLQLDRKAGVVVLNDNYWTECTICKETVPCSDFYIGSETGFASVFFAHNCNGQDTFCPSVGVPFKKETKEKWNGLLFGK